jgi:hypothetical protein
MSSSGAWNAGMDWARERGYGKLRPRPCDGKGFCDGSVMFMRWGACPDGAWGRVSPLSRNLPRPCPVSVNVQHPERSPSMEPHSS